MAINYTPLLSLAEPVSGTQSGSWGNDINQGLTDYLDIAVAGAQVISGSQTAVTLSKTTGSAAATNIAQVGSAGVTGTAQYAIINCTGNPAGMLTITAPATSKTYVVINATSTSQSVKIVGSGPTTGVTVAAAQAALIAWKGSDFALIATTDVSKLTGTLGIANGGTGQTTQQAALNALVGTQTANRVLRSDGTNSTLSQVALATDVTGTLPVANGGTGVSTSTGTGAVVLSNNPTFPTDITVNGLTVGTGPGGISNTALGDDALSSLTSGSNNVAIGQASLESSTSGGHSVAVGGSSMRYTLGGDNVAVGYYTLRGTPGALAEYNVAVGSNAMSYTVNGSYNTVIGPQSGIQIQNGNYNSLLGYAAGQNVNTNYNTLIGAYAGSALGTGSKNTIIGSYTGNAGGLDIRFSSNYIVLSDGDGNPRAYWNAADATFNGKLTLTAAFRSAVGTVASAATITPTSDASNQYNVTALAVPATFAAPSGTPVDGQRLLLRIKDNGTARALTWNAIYRVIGVTLPTSTTAGKTIYIDCVYNSADAKWDVMDVKVQV